MTTAKVLVNGSLMEKSFFDDNVEEANSLAWTRVAVPNTTTHQHCIICTKPISLQPLEEAYRSSARYLCAYCREHYID
jgi:hypothetical protein